jgi:hypothetical protein
VVVLGCEDGDPFAVELFDTPDSGPPEAADEANKVDVWLSDSRYDFRRVAGAEDPWFASWGPAVTGGAIVGTAAAAAKKALGESPKTKALLVEIAKDSNSPAIRADAESLARRIAAKQALLLKVYKPLGKWLGLGSEYFETQLALDMADCIADIPDEQLTTPPLSVAVPAMIGLSYSLDECTSTF